MIIPASSNRKFSEIADSEARSALDELLSAGKAHDVPSYQHAMFSLGWLLGNRLLNKPSIACANKVLIASTAEDADFLANGVINALKQKHQVRYAIFWNNHYSLENNSDSVAPVVNSHYQDGYEDSEALVIVKSVISGSCVVKTNLLRLMSDNPGLLNSVHVASPVMHTNAENKLRSEFPISVSKNFEFSYFAIDSNRSESGEVIPGIGGEVYQLLGLMDQPAKIGFIPELVKREYLVNSI